MKISTTKTEVLHLSRNPDQCVLQVNGATLKQVEKFKYLGVAFTSDGRQDEELDIRIGKASAVMRALHYAVVMKRELTKKAKLSVFKAVFVPILTYGHESWVMTEWMRSQVQASEMRFLRRIEGVTLFKKVRSSEIRKSLNIEQLLLRIKRSQLRWFGHVSRMPQEKLPKQALLAKANGRRPVGRPRTRWTDYIEDLRWNRNDGGDGRPWGVAAQSWATAPATLRKKRAMKKEVQWIAAMIAEICFITYVMLHQKIKQFLHDFSSFWKVMIEFSKSWQTLLKSQPMTVRVLR